MGTAVDSFAGYERLPAQPVQKDLLMDQSIGETWRFTAHTSPVEQVYLAVDGPVTASRWIEMQPVPGEPGAWSVVATIMPGQHRLRCFTVDNGTTLNCGTSGLYGERTSEPNTAVQIDDMMALAVPA